MTIFRLGAFKSRDPNAVFSDLKPWFVDAETLDEAVDALEKLGWIARSANTLTDEEAAVHVLKGAIDLRVERAMPVSE